MNVIETGVLVTVILDYHISMYYSHENCRFLHSNPPSQVFFLRYHYYYYYNYYIMYRIYKQFRAWEGDMSGHVY